ncbi:ultraviolet-B receptor UVR8 isoform X4 [Vitis vinifera]|uniref:ultraviolet-B receptor UVR8 isoform X4 n=1 Tax=Vitis vinifera TaxID=29760 RepID=UPI0028832D8B|nr:ultraviolet-B receptor UVR8 isoform X4 [Vitis vinifera]
MNGEGKGPDEAVVMEGVREKLVFMMGYLPGALPQRSPLLSPIAVRSPASIHAWRDVCGGGCGFAMAISESGKLITWGSTDDLGQSYVTSGKHGETPEPFPLPTEASIVKAAAGWAHCASVTENGEVYTWGWKECVPSGKVFGDPSVGGSLEKDVFERQSSFLTEQVSPRTQGSRSTAGGVSGTDSKGGGEESTKRRRMLSSKQAAESSSGDETLSALPCLVTLNPGVRIANVAAGGRHTLALSDVGQVWGWGYGGEGQLGLGSRIRMVSSPHPVPCVESSSYGKERSSALARGNVSTEGQSLRVPGSYVKWIACGGRHSAVITDAGALLMFGWGLYGQTLPRLLDAPSLENAHAKIVSCGARHSAIITADGKMFSWGWNKYGQLGLGDVVDRNIPSQVTLDGCTPKNVACGWWHTLLLAESPT